MWDARAHHRLLGFQTQDSPSAPRECQCPPVATRTAVSVCYLHRALAGWPHLSVYTVQIDLGHLAPLELATTLLEGEGRRDRDGGTHWSRETLSGSLRHFTGCFPPTLEGVKQRVSSRTGQYVEKVRALKKYFSSRDVAPSCWSGGPRCEPQRRKKSERRWSAGFATIAILPCWSAPRRARHLNNW